MTGVLIKRGNLDTGMHTGKTPHDDESRDQGAASTAKEHQRWSANPQKLGESPEADFPLSLGEKPTPRTPWSPTSVPQPVRESISVVTQSRVLCYHRLVLPSPSLQCLPLNRPINQEMSRWGRE